MRTALLFWTIFIVVPATTCAEINITNAANAGAHTAAEWSCIPRYPLAADDPVDEVKQICHKAITAVYFSDMSRALTIHQQLIADLETLEAQQGKLKYGPALISARLRYAELKSISDGDLDLQNKYRQMVEKLYEVNAANEMRDFETSVRRAIELLDLLNEFPEQNVTSVKIMTRRYIAWAMLATCNPKLAFEHLQKVAEMQRKLFDEQHPEYLLTMATMGHALKDMKQYVQAESYYRQYVLGLRVQQAIKTFKYARALADYAEVLIGQQKYTEAESLTLHAILVFDTEKKRNENSLAICHRNLGQIAMAMGEYKDADENFRAAWQIFNNGTNSCFSEIIQLYESIAELKRMKNRPDIADQTEKQIEELRKKYSLSEEVLHLAGKPDPTKLQ